MTPKINSPFIISVTGTKGKTTIARLLSHVFTSHGYSTLLVDTDGHSLNGKQRGTKEESEQLHGLLPATCPGKFLYELRNQPRPLAVLETAFLSGSIYGIGYFSHDIGIFTNVFEDHIGRNVKTPQEMAARKARYIFTQISTNGTAVFNADDPLVVSQLNKLPHLWPVTLLPTGLTMEHFDVAAHLKSGGHALTIQNDWLGIVSSAGFTPVLDPKQISWTFDGRFKPSLYNLLFSLAAIFAKNEHTEINQADLTAIQNYQPSEIGGRLTVFQHRGITAIVDYAHEKQSLKEIGRLARQLATNKTIGVIRLQPSRADELIKETGRFIANEFDTIIVYDKVDGITCKEFKNRGGFTRGVGEAATLLFDAIKQAQDKQHQAHREIIEERAIALAFSQAQPGDVIVHIINDNHSRSIDYVKKYLYEKH